MTADQCHYMLDTVSILSNHSREILLGPLAAFLKDVDGLSQAACVQRLIRWSYAVSSRSTKELEYDVERQVDWIYRKGVRLSCGKLVELTEEQKNRITLSIYDLLHTPRGNNTASRPLDKGQRDKATATLTVIAEYLTRLILTNDGTCYVSFATIAKRAGVKVKRVQKWMPRLCGEPWIVSPKDWDFWNFDQEYTGKMFVRVAGADHRWRKAQAYRLAGGFADAATISVEQRIGSKP